MGVDRYCRLRGRRRLGAAALVVSGLLLAGCASMPDSGDVDSVNGSPRADADSQVRVYGVPPRAGEQPREIVLGFLEATTSDDPGYDTARKYLASNKQGTWNPSEVTTILTEPPQVRVDRSGDREEDGVTISLTGKQVARVDAKHAYKPDERPYDNKIHVVRQGGEWRIDALPAGLVLGVPDFQRIYRSVNKYYFARLGPDQRRSGRSEVLVPDPVYLRKRIDPVTSTARALLDGPTNWLAPVTTTAFRPGTRVVDDRLSLDDSNNLKVRLNSRADSANLAQCRRMAAQLLFTVQDQASATVGDVRLERRDGSKLCGLTREQAQEYSPGRTEGRADRQYYIDAKHKMVSLADSDDEARRVPGAFGDGQARLGSVAVDRSERRAAGVTEDGRSLYVAALEHGSALGDVRLRARTGANDGLAPPSWDGLGDLWVVDRSTQQPRLLRLPGGTGTPEEVQVTGLDGGRITGLRVAADGVRIALLVSKGGHTKLLLGRVERAGSVSQPSLSVQGLRSVAPQLEQVDAVSWAGGSRLLAAGSEPGGLQQLQYVETDGSVSNGSALPGITGVKAVAASEAPSKALVAERQDSIVRLLPDTNWKTVTPKKGTAPVYPG
ncbi:LpqB family beta-propeller domain-containing protein [Streptomyces varsoviensis]